MLKDFIESNRCFKFICGAGNEDIESIRRLVNVYALAGCKIFDISANEEVLFAVRQVIEDTGIKDIYVGVSIGTKGDLHSNKAVIDYNKCINCGSCESVCPQSAIHYAKVKKIKCIGCGRCWKVCPKSAISYISEEKNLTEVLPALIEKGVDFIEFHVDGHDENEIFAKWNYINKVYDGLLSICISRGKIGDEGLVERIKKMISNRAPYSTIIQADGFPMSGGTDDYKTTLQAIAAAEIVQNAKLPVYLMLSGGTNSKTAELAKICGISYNAIGVGSYARKIIKNYIEREDFWTNPYVVEQAVEVVKPLVESVIF